MHTLLLAHGPVTQSTASQLTIREPHGTGHTLGTSPTPIYTFRGFGVRSTVLRRGLNIETMVIDEGAAVRVRVTLRA